MAWLGRLAMFPTSLRRTHEAIDTQAITLFGSLAWTDLKRSKQPQSKSIELPSSHALHARKVGALTEKAAAAR
jgi:hypothetical protein